MELVVLNLIGGVKDLVRTCSFSQSTKYEPNNFDRNFLQPENRSKFLRKVSYLPLHPKQTPLASQLKQNTFPPYQLTIQSQVIPCVLEHVTHTSTHGWYKFNLTQAYRIMDQWFRENPLSRNLTFTFCSMYVFRLARSHDTVRIFRQTITVSTTIGDYSRYDILMD